MGWRMEQEQWSFSLEPSPQADRMSNTRNSMSDQTSFRPVKNPFGCGQATPWSTTALVALAFSLLFPAQLGHAAEPIARQTAVTIVGDAFHINGQPTYPGRTWRGHKIEGLLMNSRMVQGIFDDLNPDTAARWACSDTGRWDADRNTS
jgi:hypothetical protein